jgi:hypothetical protein
MPGYCVLLSKRHVSVVYYLNHEDQNGRILYPGFQGGEIVMHRLFYWRETLPCRYSSTLIEIPISCTSTCKDVYYKHLLMSNREKRASNAWTHRSIAI